MVSPVITYDAGCVSVGVLVNATAELQPGMDSGDSEEESEEEEGGEDGETGGSIAVTASVLLLLITALLGR